MTSDPPVVADLPDEGEFFLVPVGASSFPRGPCAQNFFGGNLLIARSDSGDDLDPSLVHRLETGGLHVSTLRALLT